VTGPVSGATTTHTYDVQGRVRTVTDADNYTVTTDYDAFNRPTRLTYPDGTYEETTYNRLDRATSRDRLGRVTRYYYDSLRRLVSIRDPLGRATRQEWCTCGSLARLVDANGHGTSWDRDVQGRVTREFRADGHSTQYIYETTTSRLKSVTDPKQQVTTYTYFADDRIKDARYTNEQITTPDVAFTYDAAYGRLATMVDGAGTTTYSYQAVGSLGATKVAGVDGPLSNDTITYGYDELGRVTTRAINGVGVTWAFDALGRVLSEVNVLGTFAYTYDGTTNRVATVTYPNGQTSTYSYFGNNVDHRLQTIHHQYPGGPTLSKFDYTYNAAGNILTWRQQADASAVTWTYDYDAADQLVAAIKRDTAPEAILQRYAYAYDPAGNRTVEQIDDLATGASYNDVNELSSQQPAGATVFAGTVSEPAAVTVSGVPAVVTADNRFRVAVPVSAGTNTISITASDGSGNAATQQFQLMSSGTTKTFTYDANGNLTSDGTRTFEWDALNQLVAINVGNHRSEFTYDGRQRRVRIIEKENGVTENDIRVLWCDKQICEERSSDGIAVTKRAFGQGESVMGTPHFFATDHLRSVHEVTNSANAVLARYAFDPWGRRSLISGSDVTEVGFTGQYVLPDTSISLTLYRAYDSAIGRWLSEDPARPSGTIDLYAYVANRTTVAIDPLGLKLYLCYRKAFRWGAFPGIGIHTYIWDDSTSSSCGRGDQSGSETPAFDDCREVPNSAGKEHLVMTCCYYARKSPPQWVPWANDCHTLAEGCLKKWDLDPPNNHPGRLW
jgi:RHS repeat-associated protein